MATYTLIPSSLTGGYSITNASRAYSNTSSTTYATAQLNNTDSSAKTAWLGGFDFGSIPDETIVSVTIKCKVKSQYGCYARVYSSSDSERVALSNSVIVGNLSSHGLITFDLTSSKDVIISYLATGTLCIPIYISSSSSATPQIYGAEVIVETDATPKPNKIVYGENTIIDLTEDTVTRAKVLSGTTFHLPSGVRSVGTLTLPLPISPSMNTETAYPSSYGITFRELANEPTWFLVACMSPDTTTTYSTITFFMLYDGTKTYIMNGVGSSGSRTKRAVYSGSNAFTFSYTSGVLAISGNINNFNIPSTYETYTLYYI